MIADLRHALRMIVRMPVLSAVVIVSLGIGIGVNTAVFSWIQAVVLAPIPGVRDAAGFDLVEPRAETGAYPGTSWLEYGDLRQRVRTLPDLLVYRMTAVALGDVGRTERIFALLVSGNYFSALGLRPAAGRLIGPDEARPGHRDAAVVISYEFWQNRFSGSSTAIGETIRVNQQTLTIIGVTPPAFQGTVLSLNFDLWVPATGAPLLLAGSNELEDRSIRGYSVMGRRAPGATREQAQAEIDGMMRQLAADYPESNGGVRAEVLPFWQSPRGPQRLLSRALFTLQGVMLLLLLAVCGNTANLVLARASVRQREIGIRTALGASGRRVMTLLLTENIVLAAFGAALGIGIAMWGTVALRAVPFIGAFPIRFQTHVDLVGLAFAAALGIVSGLLFGIAPAVQLARVDPQTALRSGAAQAGRSGVRHALMGAEVALATVVLLAAALFFRSFNETHDTNPGFTREGVLLGVYDMNGRSVDQTATREFATRLLDAVRLIPGVESAAIATSVPLDIHGLPARSFTLEGRGQSTAAPDQALSNTVTPGYFQTMNIPLRAGRDFSDLRDRVAPPEAVVNDEFVRRFIGDGLPLGRRVTTRGRAYTIVGIARTSLYDAFGEPPKPIIYLSYRDRPAAAGEIHLRTRPGAEALLGPAMERAVRDLDPTLPLYDVRTLADHVEKNLFLRRIPARMFVVLGPLLLVLAAIGIYAVVDTLGRAAHVGDRHPPGARRIGAHDRPADHRRVAPRHRGGGSARLAGRVRHRHSYDAGDADCAQRARGCAGRIDARRDGCLLGARAARGRIGCVGGFETRVRQRVRRAYTAAVHVFGLVRRRPLAMAALIGVVAAAVPRVASADLGGDARSVDADRAKMQGALIQIVRSDTHVVHEMRAASGTTVREYLTTTGTVFAVAWQGPWLPDMRQILGSHFEQYQNAVRAQSSTRRSRGTLTIDDGGLVVQMSGHPRAFSGRAYVPALLPQGMRLESIR